MSPFPAFWELPRALGLTDFIGLEDRLKRQDAWLAGARAQIFQPDTWVNSISQGGATVAAEATYALAGEELFARTLAFGRRLFSAAETAKDALISSGRAKHILYGDASGGGHKWGLTRLFNGKTKFPWSWSDDKILNAVSEVATNPSSKWIPPAGVKPGTYFTKAGRPHRFTVEGMYEGVKIRAIVQGGEVITGFPIP
jgi:hypothetical protein